jgi:hypothetical protein
MGISSHQTSHLEEVVHALRKEIELRESTEQSLFAELGALKAENRLDKERIEHQDEAPPPTRVLTPSFTPSPTCGVQRIRELQRRLFEKAEGAVHVTSFPRRSRLARSAAVGYCGHPQEDLLALREYYEEEIIQGRPFSP